MIFPKERFLPAFCFRRFKKKSRFGQLHNYSALNYCVDVFSEKKRRFFFRFTVGFGWILGHYSNFAKSAVLLHFERCFLPGLSVFS